MRTLGFSSAIFFLLMMITVSGGQAFDYGAEDKFDVPLRELSIIATPEGYYPKVVTVFENEKVRLFFTSTMKDPSCLLFSEKKFYLSSSSGKMAEGELFFDKPGTFEFHCPAGNIKGSLTVLKRPGKNAARDIASEKAKKKQPKIWRPRED